MPKFQKGDIIAYRIFTFSNFIQLSDSYTFIVDIIKDGDGTFYKYSDNYPTSEERWLGSEYMDQNYELITSIFREN